MADMPSTATCSRCARSFEVRSQMSLKDKRTIPMLVVPSEVDSVEAALAVVVCQVCLERQGSPERGLHAVLKSLGLEDTPARPIAVVMAGSARRPSIAARIVIAPARLGAASLTSVTIVTTPRTRSRAEGHSDRSDDRPHIKLPPPAPLRGKIGKSDGNAAVLEGVRAKLQQQEAARRVREREERRRRFDRTVKVCRLMLLRTRKSAPFQDIDERIVAVDRKLRRAAASDPKQRDKNALMALVGTSVEELVNLSRLVYLTMSVEPDELAGTRITRLVPRTPLPMTPHRPAHPYEQVMVDVFPGGRRSEHWGIKGRSTVAMLYEVAVMRPIHEDPVPNPKLSGSGNDPTTHPSSSPLGAPKIVYPQGGEFGGMHEVLGSVRDSLPVFPWEEKPQGWAAYALTSWLGDHLDVEFQCNGLALGLASFLALSMEDIVMDVDESQDGERVLCEDDDLTHMTELPSTT